MLKLKIFFLFLALLILLKVTIKLFLKLRLDFKHFYLAIVNRLRHNPYSLFLQVFQHFIVHHCAGALVTLNCCTPNGADMRLKRVEVVSWKELCNTFNTLIDLTDIDLCHNKTFSCFFKTTVSEDLYDLSHICQSSNFGIRFFQLTILFID